MSGSSGGSPSGSGSFTLDCSGVSFKTQLRSISEESVQSIDIGMRLIVVENDGAVVALHPDNGDIVGSITYSKNVELIRCMDEGHEYVAIVQGIDDGLVTVQVVVK